MPRPSNYSQEVADTICSLIAEGQSLRSICSSDDMPDKSTVFRWLAQHAAFRDQYTHSRAMQADAMAEDILDIADDGTNDYITKSNADGSTYEAVNSEHIQRSRLRVDARKWLMSKMAPKKYGEKLDLNVEGTLQTATDEQIDARLAQLLGKAGVGPTAGGEGEA